MRLTWLAFGLAMAAQGAAAQPLLVSAAASLRDAFRDVGKAFEATHAGATVSFNFAASDILSTQIAKGAPADVFASADEQAMDRAVHANVIDASTRRDFASNVLVVAVPAAATSVPASLADLRAERFRRIALGSPATVPAGRYAKGALDEAKLWTQLEPRFVFAQNVRQVLDYVAREEVEAGFVYATDAAIMPDKVKVAFDAGTAKPVRYPIAVVKDTKHGALAQAFVAYVASDAGQSVLRRYGFRAP